MPGQARRAGRDPRPGARARARPGPGPREGKGPPVEKHRVEPPGQVKKGVGADDGVLKRVPKSSKP